MTDGDTSPAQPAFQAAPPDPIAAAEAALAQAVAAHRPDPAALAPAIDRGVAAWVMGEIAGGPIARATQAWNQLQSALPALKAAILKEID